MMITGNKKQSSGFSNFFQQRIYILLSKEYFRLQIREHPICKGDQKIPKEVLEKIFDIKITSNNRHKYKKKFLKKCKEFMDKLEDEKFLKFTKDKLYEYIPREHILESK